MYHRFLVGNDDHFDAEKFPQVEAELNSLTVEMSKVSSKHKVEMLLSFVQHQSIDPDLAASNVAFAEMLHSRSLPTRSIEALFASCSNNKLFSHQLQVHMKDRLATAVFLPFVLRSR